MVDIARDEHVAHQGLAIVEAYEQFVNYLYPILQNAPRKHGVAREMALQAMFSHLRELTAAGDPEAPAAFRAAWLGHAQWADSHHLLKSLGLET